MATASETSGPPPIDEHPLAHQRERRQRRDHRAEAHEARDADRRQHRCVGAGIHALAQRRQAPPVDDDQHEDRRRERHRHRPHAAHRLQGSAAPALLGQERGVEARQHDHGHQKIDDDHHDERQGGEDDRRARLALVAAPDLGRIELARGGGALAHQLIARAAASAALPASPPRVAIAFARAPRGAFGAASATTGRSPA